MAVQELSDGGPDGTRMGASASEKLSFYGATAIVQPSAANQAAITAGATTTACNNLVIELRLALVNLGLIKGGS